MDNLPQSNRSKFVPNLNAVRYKHKPKINNPEQSDASKSSVDVPTNSTDRTQVTRGHRFNRIRNLVQTEGVFEGTSHGRNRLHTHVPLVNSRSTPHNNGVTTVSFNSSFLSKFFGFEITFPTVITDGKFNDDKKLPKCEKDEGLIDSMAELKIEAEAPLSLQSLKKGLNESENFVFRDRSNSASKFTIIQFLNPLLPNVSDNMEGPVGKVVQYKSGKWKLIIGKNVFDFQKSTKKPDANELCTLAVDDEKLHGDLVHLGSAAGYWILTPSDYNLV